MASPMKRILVLGASSAGKTSLINALTEQNQPVNNSADGGTLETMKFDIYEHNGMNYEFIDSAGLFQAVRGDLLSDKQLFEHLCDLLDYARSGIHLLIFVTRNGTIHQFTQDIYNLVINVMCDEKTPAICVVTGCENEENMSDWVNKNKQHFSKNRMNFEAIIGTCFAKGGRMEVAYSPLREQSSNEVWEAIEKHVLHESKFRMTDRSRECDQEQINIFIRQKSSETEQQRPAQLCSDAKEKTSKGWTAVRAATQLLTRLVSGANYGDVLMTEQARTSLSKWLPQSDKKWQLLYKCPSTGFDSKEFHNKCDNQGPTVTLIQYNKQFLFGGFTRAPWSTTNDKVVHDEMAFLFTLIHPSNIEPVQFRMNPCTVEIAVYHHSDYGPAFGMLGKDLCIRDVRSGEPTVNIGFPKCYCDTARKKYLTFASSDSFSTTDIEVYLLTED